MKKYGLLIVSIAVSLICLLVSLVKSTTEPNVGWLSKELGVLENQAPFNPRCTHCFDIYTNTSDFTAASKLLYDETGLQLYLVDMCVSVVENNIQNEYDMYNYVLDYIEENINTDNAVIIYNCYQEEDDLLDEDGYHMYLSIYDQLYIGESAGNVLKSDALSIFNASLNHFIYSYGDTEYTDTIKLFLNHTKYADECKEAHMRSIVVWLLPVPVLLAVNVYVIVKRRKHEDTVEILETPIDKIYNDDLVDKYTK